VRVEDEPIDRPAVEQVGRQQVRQHLVIAKRRSYE
jgi:hypothetical protein